MLNVLQITDLHIKSQPGDTMFGVDTEELFRQTLQTAHEQHGRFDLILVTGDLAQDPSADAYSRICSRLLSYDTRCLCLPGNHDDFELMKTCLNVGPISCDKYLILDDWQIIALNSQMPDSPVGELAADELYFLKNRLISNPMLPTLIAVHHPCIASGSPWLDTMQIQNSDAFWALIRTFPQVKAVTFGHIHQELYATENRIAIFGSPASGFQFTPNSTEFSIARTPPGYRTFKLLADGSLQSQCDYLPIKLDSLDQSAHGY